MPPVSGFGHVFLALIDAVVDVQWDPEAFRRQDNHSPDGEVLDKPVGRGVRQRI